MIKLLKRILLFLFILWIVDLLFGFVMNTLIENSPDGRYYKARYSLEKSKEDIVIFGSSRAETNYVPSIFSDSLGMSCWNTGRGGQSLPFWMAMQQGILQRHAPKIIIINIEPEFLSIDLKAEGFYEKAGFLRPFYKNHKEIQSILHKISDSEKYLLYSNLYAYNSSFYYALRPFVFQGLDGKAEDNGWKPRIGMINMPNTKEEIIDIKKELHPETVSLFEEYIQQFEEKGCNVFVVVSPDYQKQVLTTSTINFIKKLKKVTFINFGDHTGFTKNPEFFKDPDHLNRTGAIEFSKQLAHILKLKMAKAK